MPKFTYDCPKCGHSVQKITNIKHVESCSCGTVMTRRVPVLRPSTVKETIDTFMGTVQDKEQSEKVKENNDLHYWSVEVPRMVNSGVYTIETMVENGWVYFNDKNEMCINTKPPSKR